jgi:predicted hydrocarbon binding protein
MAKVKGVVILNGRDYALANGGEQAWGRVLERLPLDDRQALAAVIPVGWYDMGLYERTNRALADALGGGSPDVMTAAGRFAAEHDLKTIHRLFLRLASPAYVIERSASFWRRFQDSGTWKVVREPPNRVRATLEGWGAQDEMTCIRLAAYMFRLFQLVGAQNGSLERVACRSRGDPACVFEAKWD